MYNDIFSFGPSFLLQWEVLEGGRRLRDVPQRPGEFKGRQRAGGNQVLRPLVQTQLIWPTLNFFLPESSLPACLLPCWRLYIFSVQLI